MKRKKGKICFVIACSTKNQESQGFRFASKGSKRANEPSWNICVISFLTFVNVLNNLLDILFLSLCSQGSNNSDQSSGYLSGSGGSNSLPVNTNPETPQTQYDYKYGQTRLDNLNDKFQSQQQQKSDLKKLSLTSSMNDYSSLSTHEHDMEYSHGHK